SAVLAQAIQAEIDARQELVDQLTSITADKGPLGNFGASLLGLATERIPAFAAALAGFVQAGPLGALIAVFSQLLGESEAFAGLEDTINRVLEPLANIVGNILSPVFTVRGTVLTGLVNTIVAVWNFLFGWLGLGVNPVRPV